MKEVERFESTGREGTTHYQRALAAAELFELEKKGLLQSLVRAEEMEWEDSPQGRLKHMVNEDMHTREFALDMYIQVIEPGQHSGKHRHFSEEMLFVLEGEGYDLHWDPEFAVETAYRWSWSDEPKKFEWSTNDFVYIPPYVTHQHFAGSDTRVRFVSATARVIKALGFDGLEQVESV